MATTIQISEELQALLCKRKLYDRETYEEVIYDLLEDTMEINNETKKELGEARADIRAGRLKSLSELKKELNL